jgi:DNA-binding XRE family transcriptional regulator
LKTQVILSKFAEKQMTIDAAEYLEKKLGVVSFGTFLVAVRGIKELSQVQMAQKLKVSRSMICDIEKGRQLVSPELAIKIARIGGFPETFALQFCFQDRINKLKLKLKVTVAA